MSQRTYSAAQLIGLRFCVPMQKLGPAFGVTDTGLRKRLDALGIPGPDMAGYHALLANGYDTVAVPKFPIEFLEVPHTFKGVRSDISFEDVMAGDLFKRIQRDIRPETPPATKTLTRGEMHQLLWAHRLEDLAGHLRLSPAYLDKVAKANRVPRPPAVYWNGLKRGATIARHSLEGEHLEQVLIAPYDLDIQALLNPSDLRFQPVQRTPTVLGLHAQALADDWFALPRGPLSIASVSALAEGLKIFAVDQAERSEIIDVIMSLPPATSLKRKLAEHFQNERLHSETTSSLISFRTYVSELVRKSGKDTGGNTDEDFVNFSDEITDEQREMMVLSFVSAMIRAQAKGDWLCARDLTIVLILFEFRIKLKDVLQMPHAGLDVFRRKITTKAGKAFKLTPPILWALTRYGQLAPESVDGSIFVSTQRGQLTDNAFRGSFSGYRDKMGLSRKFTFGSVMKYVREGGELDKSVLATLAF